MRSVLGTRIRLPAADGAIVDVALHDAVAFPRSQPPARSRTAYAAAHVVADPFGDNTPGAPAAIDWDATLAVRRELWDLGLGVAEALDTAQRGMGLDWAATRQLIRRSTADARACGGSICAGAGTDQRLGRAPSLQAVIADYLEQVQLIEDSGATVVLMASRQLAALARGPEDYQRVYDAVLSQVSRPVILHWLGTMFDPLLVGYWGAADLDAAARSLLTIVDTHSAVVDGVKVSILEVDRETALRRALPSGVKLYTGDDLHYPELIKGADGQFSHALLGVFAAIAPAAAAALQALDAGDLDSFTRCLDPTLPLAHALFAAPTWHYKTGIAFLAWLRGSQSGFTMISGQQSARSIVALAEIFRLADKAGVLPDPEEAAVRMRGLLAVAGIR